MTELVRQTDSEMLLTYVVASGELRYIEIGERQVFLQYKPGTGPIVCAAMPDSKPGCEVNLSEVLLEVALTSENRTAAHGTPDSAGLFGVQLGRVLAVRLCQDTSSVETLTAAFECILNSMQVPFTVDRSLTQIRFHPAYCPLHRASNSMGASRGLASAHRAFISLCKTTIRIMAPDWLLVHPGESESVAPIQFIEISRRES